MITEVLVQVVLLLSVTSTLVFLHLQCKKSPISSNMLQLRIRRFLSCKAGHNITPTWIKTFEDKISVKRTLSRYGNSSPVCYHLFLEEVLTKTTKVKFVVLNAKG